MGIRLDYIDPEGDGIAYRAPYPNGARGTTIYNGSTGCSDCGLLLGPVESLNSDLCSGCSRRKAAKSIANRMA